MLYVLLVISKNDDWNNCNVFSFLILFARILADSAHLPQPWAISFSLSIAYISGLKYRDPTFFIISELYMFSAFAFLDAARAVPRIQPAFTAQLVRSYRIRIWMVLCGLYLQVSPVFSWIVLALVLSGGNVVIFSIH